MIEKGRQQSGTDDHWDFNVDPLNQFRQKGSAVPSKEESAAHPTKGISPDAFSSLFQAISGLRNMRAAGAMLICFALSVVVSALLSIMLGKGITGMFVAALTTLFLIASGIHAGGLFLMDLAKEGLQNRGAVGRCETVTS
jgi:hypothetical protein